MLRGYDPGAETGFDSPESLVGYWYPTPGGLKESVEQIFGRKYHIRRIEGPQLAQEYLERNQSVTQRHTSGHRHIELFGRLSVRHRYRSRDTA